MIDSAGRLVVPKALRDRFHLRAGDELECDVSADGICLRPVAAPVQMVRKNGFWTAKTGVPMTAEDARRILENTRDERDDALRT